MVGERPDSLASRSTLSSLMPISAKGLLEGIVIQQVEGNIRLQVNGVAGPNDDAMKPAIDGRQFAFRLLGVDDRNER